MHISFNPSFAMMNDGKTYRKVPTDSIMSVDIRSRNEFYAEIQNKDNVGMHQRPKSFTRSLNRRMRRNETVKLNTLVNKSYTVDDYEELFMDIIHEHPKRYKEWYW